MNQVSAYNPTKHHNLPCSDSMTMADRELAAFFVAVNALFGPEQARLAAEDWLHELAAMSSLPFSSHEWRRITLEVAARLASRTNSITTDFRTLADAAAKAICQ